MKRHGCKVVTTLENLKTVEMPYSTNTHVPIAHDRLFDLVVNTLNTLDYSTDNHQLICSEDGQRFIGTFIVDHPKHECSSETEEFKIGVLNSHDKSMPAGLITGSNTFVCANGQWSGELTLSRKHTKNAWDDIHYNVRQFVFDLKETRDKTFKQLEDLRSYDFDSQMEVNDFLVQSIERNILAPSLLLQVLDHWKNPEHTEFKDRNGYSLYNAFTSHWRGSNPMTLSRRTTKLRSFIDEFKTPSVDYSMVSDYDFPDEGIIF